MKKQFRYAALATLLLTFSSCQKSFTCECIDTNVTSGNGVVYTGTVEATSKANAVKKIESQYSGATCSCN